TSLPNQSRRPRRWRTGHLVTAGQLDVAFFFCLSSTKTIACLLLFRAQWHYRSYRSYQYNTGNFFYLQRFSNGNTADMKKSAPQHAAEMIQQRIRNGDYAVGSALPGQRQLAEVLKVGRPAIREAISALEGLGIVEVQPGRGVFV